MASRRTELAIEKIIASCDGSVRSALEALLLVNEHLEAELHQVYAAYSLAAHPDRLEDAALASLVIGSAIPEMHHPGILRVRVGARHARQNVV